MLTMPDRALTDSEIDKISELTDRIVNNSPLDKYK
jgi:hypothetical protein